MISVQKGFVCVCWKSSNDIYIFKFFAERFWKKIRLPVLANASVSVKMKPAFAMLSLSQVIIRTYCLDKGGTCQKNNIEIIIIVLSEISGSCVLGEGKTDVDCPCLTALLIV